MNLIISKSKLLLILSIVLSLIFFAACDDTETTDETDFALCYTGMTDIGPSMTRVISTPSYIGGKPSGFEIFKVTLDGESYSSSSFVINEDEGAITISETAGMYQYQKSLGNQNNGHLFGLKYKF